MTEIGSTGPETTQQGVSSPHAETVAVLLTGQGRGAIATILVAGPRATELVRRYFRHPTSSRSVELTRDAIRFGSWEGDPNTEELVVCQTGVCEVEIHCHGGHMASRSTLDNLIRAGATELTVQQWFERTTGDPSIRTARLWLAEAPTERTAGVLLDQSRGAMRSELQDLLRLVETGQVPVALERLYRLQDYYRVGSHLVTPWSVVLAGRPNAGKSSLVNTLLGYDRSIVFDQPGTTRDLVCAETVIEGWPVKLTDTAGLREEVDATEARGMDLARRQIEKADLIVWVQDGTNLREEPQISGDFRVEGKVLRVCSKADLVTNHPRTKGLWTSAVTGQGIEQLLGAIVSALVPFPPPPGSAVPLSHALACRLAAVQRHLQQGERRDAVDLLRLGTA